MFLANKLNKGGSLGGYQISRSLRFNSADSAYLNRTPASAGSRTTWAWSAWVKRGQLGALQAILTAGGDAPNPRGLIEFEAADTIRVGFNDGTSWYLASTSAVFRDPSAWYHVVVALDLTNGTNANRVKLYVNNVLQSFASTPTWPTTDQVFNNNVVHRLGSYYGATPSNFLSGYMTEVNFIDGQALTPSSFGETNAQTGVWQPKAYSGSYGTNGFYLNFSDNSNTTAATLGKDYSGNGNNWTPNNFSVTAGAGNDSLVDSPTSYGTDTGVGGTVRGNYATLNPLNNPQSATLTNGNLDCATPATLFAARTVGTIGVSSGKWYWEFTKTSGAAPLIGIALSSEFTQVAPGVTSTSYSYYAGNGQKYNNNTGTAYGATYANGDVMGVALDMDAGTLTFYKNNTSQGTAFTGLSGAFVPAFSGDASGSSLVFVVNFGQRPFAYTAPSGFKALCTQNLPVPSIGATTATLANKYFNPVLYTGNGATNRAITGVGFQPDWVWIKGRSYASNHLLSDAVRGTGKSLFSNLTEAESTTRYLSAFGSDGFTTGPVDDINENTRTYVAWNWKANGSGSTNTAGSITSTVSANTTSGFSVVTYTGNATSNQTFGHGLGAKVDFAIIKSRSAVSSPAWMVWHRSVCSGNGKALALEETNAIQGPFGTPIWDSSNTSAQSSTTTFTIGANTTINASGATYVAYCFAEVAGYSKFGSYTGNGSADGPFVYCGFRPAFIMRKRTDSAPAGQENWIMQDVRRSPYNEAGNALAANREYAEATFGTTNYGVDVLSNGFKVRDSSTYTNASGGTYIYMAFAESPLKFSLAR